MALKISLVYLFIAIASVDHVLSFIKNFGDRRHNPTTNLWLDLSGNRSHVRHGHLDNERVVRETTTTASPWTPRSRVSVTRLPQSVDSWGHLILRRKLSDDTRTTSHAGYRGHLWHQPREAVTQSYQLIPTTAPPYTRHHSGRRVCSRQGVAVPHRGEQIRLIYTELTTSSFFCCPGWSVTHLSFSCNKPICSMPCLNGGTCASPGKCSCPKGYIGNQCQTDVDECEIEKPCGQLCTNLPGNYRCHCRIGFHLQQDGQSCRRNNTDENASEAHDLESEFHDVPATKNLTTSRGTYNDTENEVNDDDQDYEVILKRLTKLEKQVARNKKRDTEASEMNTKVTLAVESVNEMKRTVENVQLMQQEIHDMRSKIKQYEIEMKKIEHLMNRIAELESRPRTRCRILSSLGRAVYF